MTVDEKMASFIERMHASGVVGPQDLGGCSSVEIEALEKRYRLTLPRSYRLFLTYMGHCAGNLASGNSELLYPAVLVRTHKERYPEPYMPPKPNWLDRLFYRLNRPYFLKLAKERAKDDAYALPQDGLIIFSDLGLPFFWMIRCNRDDDSPVYTFDYEGDRIELRQEYDSLFDFLDMLLKEALRTANAT